MTDDATNTETQPERGANDDARQQAAAAYGQHAAGAHDAPVVDTTDADDVADIAVEGGAQAAAEVGASPADAPDAAQPDVATDAAPDAAPDAASLEEPVELDPEARAAADPRTPGQLLTELELVTSERDEYLEALQRLQAEFDNFRRRTTREAAGARQAGVGDLAAKLLDVLDDLDRTHEVATESADQGLAGGISAVRRKLMDALSGVGIERVEAADVPFDANRHEAVQQVPAEEPVDEPEVAQVLRPGYLHGERVLRAAMVVVRQ